LPAAIETHVTPPCCTATGVFRCVVARAPAKRATHRTALRPKSQDQDYFIDPASVAEEIAG